jgi:hypothetical protein
MERVMEFDRPQRVTDIKQLPTLGRVCVLGSRQPVEERFNFSNSASISFPL